MSKINWNAVNISAKIDWTTLFVQAKITPAITKIMQRSIKNFAGKKPKPRISKVKNSLNNATITKYIGRSDCENIRRFQFIINYVKTSLKKCQQKNALIKKRFLLIFKLIIKNYFPFLANASL